MKIALFAMLHLLATVSMGAGPDELFWRFSFGSEAGYLITGGTLNSIATATPSNPVQFRVVDIYMTESDFGFETKSWRHGNISGNYTDTYLYWDGNSVYEVSLSQGNESYAFAGGGDVFLTLMPSQSMGMVTSLNRADPGGPPTLLLSSPLSILPAPRQIIDQLDISFRQSGNAKRIGEGLVERHADRQRMAIDLKRGRSEEVVFVVKSTSDLALPLSMKMTGKKLPCSVRYDTFSDGSWFSSRNLLNRVYNDFGILKAGKRFVFKMKLRPKTSKDRPSSREMKLSANPLVRPSQKDQVIVNITGPSSLRQTARGRKH